MSFEEDMDPIFEGIKAAAEAAGLEAKRVKYLIGEYKIDLKLIDMLHQACMVVVDLTHERPNVYFELGYARGIGKTVITTARRGTSLHFDVQSWTCDFYMDSRVLERRLTERFKIEWARLSATPAAQQRENPGR
jgi:ribosomal protein S18